MKKRFIGIACMLVLLIGACFWSTYESQQYYARELTRADSIESVQVDGVTYDVIGADVRENGKSVAGIAAWRPRKLAYEVELARLDPFFGIAGTDPKNLKTQTALLTPLEEKYAVTQKTATTSSLMYSLYPVSFLNALADLEEKRQALLAEPTEANASAYESAAEETADLKIRAIAAFQSAFVKVVRPTFSVYLFEGVLTGKGELSAIAALQKDAASVRASVRERSVCLDGWFAACADSLQLPAFPVQKDTGEDFPTASEKEIVGLWQDAVRGAQSPLPSLLVRLSQSACLSAFNPPYDVWAVYDRTSTGNILEILDAADLLFTPTDQPNSTYLEYVKKQLHMSYSPADLFMYYTCPQAGIDIGRAVATIRVASFASAHPLLAPSQNLQSDSLSQYAAQVYLNTAIAQASAEQNASDLHALEELALMEKEKTAGLDEVVADIVHVGTVDTNPALSIIETSAQTTYATHSAFPTFLRIGASGDGILDGLFTATSSVQNVLLPHLTSYWKIRSEVPHTKIIHDIREYLLFEGRYVPDASSSPLHP